MHQRSRMPIFVLMLVACSNQLWATGKIQVNTTTKDCGSVVLGTYRNSSLGVFNVGDDVLTVTAVTSDDPQFTPFFDAPFELGVDNGVGRNIQFQPAIAGISTATLTILSSDPDSPVTTVTLIGNGVPCDEQYTAVPESQLDLETTITKLKTKVSKDGTYIVSATVLLGQTGTTTTLGVPAQQLFAEIVDSSDHCSTRHVPSLATFYPTDTQIIKKKVKPLKIKIRLTNNSYVPGLFLRVTTDFWNNVPETDESNNIQVVPLVVN